MSNRVDQGMKSLSFVIGKGEAARQFVAYCQVPFYDDGRCLVTYSVFAHPTRPDDAAVLSNGFYVHRRPVEGGVAWQVDVVPYLEGKIEELVFNP